MRSFEPMATRFGRVCRALLLTGLGALACATVAGAQDARGSIAGRVTDTSGAVLPGASRDDRQHRNQHPHHAHHGRPGALLGALPAPRRLQGLRDARRLPHGRQRATCRSASATRSSTTSRSNRAASRKRSASSPSGPSSKSGSATMGQVIDSKLISEIPLGDGTAYGLTRLVAGASFERSYALQRPMDNDNLRGAHRQRHDQQRVHHRRLEQHRLAARASASSRRPTRSRNSRSRPRPTTRQVGHTGAGSVNLALKSGTNAFRGAASYFNRDDSRSANLFASNARGTEVSPARLQPVQRHARRPHHQEQDVLHGLVRAPAGRHRSRPSPRRCRPSACGNGDFSELLAAGIQIYNPFSARLVNGVVTRDPFPGNVIPQNLLNPIALNVLKYYPLPNQAGAVDTTSNYFVEQPWTYGYDFQMARVDHQWNAPNRTYVRWTRNFRREERYNWAGEQNGLPITQGSTDRFNLNVALGHTAILRQRLVRRRQGRATCASTTTCSRTRRSTRPTSATRPRCWRCSAATSTSRASASNRAAAPPPARSARSAASRTASTPAARSRSTTCSSRRRSPATSARTR